MDSNNTYLPLWRNFGQDVLPGVVASGRLEVFDPLLLRRSPIALAAESTANSTADAANATGKTNKSLGLKLSSSDLLILRLLYQTKLKCK